MTEREAWEAYYKKQDKENRRHAILAVIIMNVLLFCVGSTLGKLSTLLW